MNTTKPGVEWPTLWLIAACYLLILTSLFILPGISLTIAIVVCGCAIALQASLQHEVIHGHPFRRQWLNDALIWPPFTICIPYLRFRDTHLAHHRDSMLTDPYDDPETNYLDPQVWHGLSGPLQLVLRINNTLAGRILIGPIVGQVTFMAGEWRSARRGDLRVRRGWLLHIPAMLCVLGLVAVSSMPIWAFFIAAYLALSLLKIRTFLEHQAHEKSRARTVIIRDKGPLAFLFLNNNFHVVHHMHPRLPWYNLPQVFDRNPNRYLHINDGYTYATYFEVFRRYFWRAKDPVPHPLWKGPSN